MRGRQIPAVIGVKREDRGDLRRWPEASAASAQDPICHILAGACHCSGDSGGGLGFQGKWPPAPGHAAWLAGRRSAGRVCSAAENGSAGRRRLQGALPVISGPLAAQPQSLIGRATRYDAAAIRRTGADQEPASGWSCRSANWNGTPASPQTRTCTPWTPAGLAARTRARRAAVSPGSSPARAAGTAGLQAKEQRVTAASVLLQAEIDAFRTGMDATRAAYEAAAEAAEAVFTEAAGHHLGSEKATAEGARPG
jgi:hypothetical protein